MADAFPCYLGSMLVQYRGFYWKTGDDLTPSTELKVIPIGAFICSLPGSGKGMRNSFVTHLVNKRNLVKQWALGVLSTGVAQFCIVHDWVGIDSGGWTMKFLPYECFKPYAHVNTWLHEPQSPHHTFFEGDMQGVNIYSSCTVQFM